MLTVALAVENNNLRGIRQRPYRRRQTTVVSVAASILDVDHCRWPELLYLFQECVPVDDAMLRTTHAQQDNQQSWRRREFLEFHDEPHVHAMLTTSAVSDSIASVLSYTVRRRTLFLCRKLSSKFSTKLSILPTPNHWASSSDGYD